MLLEDDANEAGAACARGNGSPRTAADGADEGRSHGWAAARPTLLGRVRAAARPHLSCGVSLRQAGAIHPSPAILSRSTSIGDAALDRLRLRGIAGQAAQGGWVVVEGVPAI